MPGVYVVDVLPVDPDGLGTATPPDGLGTERGEAAGLVLAPLPPGTGDGLAYRTWLMVLTEGDGAATITAVDGDTPGGEAVSTGGAPITCTEATTPYPSFQTHPGGFVFVPSLSY